MTVDRIRQALTTASAAGPIKPADVDRLMMEARDNGGLDAAERTELLKVADTFDDASKQRLVSHLAAMSQTKAWVNVEAGAPATIEGRYATMTVNVPGLSAKVGLFDNCLAINGTATADGRLNLTIEGTQVSVDVKRGETAAQVLTKVRGALPSQVTGALLSGDVQPYDGSNFNGRLARRSETAAHLMLYKPADLGLRPGERPMRVVVTGYGAFMGITNNPSANMAQRLSELGVPGGVVEYHRLDVTPKAVDEFMTQLRRNPPDVVLSMGVSSHSQVEERPENQLGANRDGNNEMMTAREVRPGGEQELHTDLPVETIEWALKGFGDQRQVFTSRGDANYTPDRSAYLCNYLGYNLAAEFGASDKTTGGFIHVTAETPVEQMHSVLRAVTARQLSMRRGESEPRS